MSVQMFVWRIGWYPLGSMSLPVAGVDVVKISGTLVSFQPQLNPRRLNADRMCLT